MKTSAIIDRILAGEAIIVVEFRKTDADEIRRSVVKTGQASVMPIAKHTVLLGDKSYEVPEFLPDNTDIKAVRAPFPKGQKVWFLLEGMETTKWGDRLNGSFIGTVEA